MQLIIKQKPMKSFLIFAVALLLGLSTFANNNAIIDSANICYTNASYEKSIALYEQVINNGYESSELYYNLGNAYYRSNKVALAILNYERSLVLDPNNEDAKFNLQIANTLIVDKIDVIPQFFLSSWWSKVIKIFSSNIWALLSMISFVVALVLFLLFFLSGNVSLRKSAFWVGILLSILTIFSFNFARKQKWLDMNEPAAIIISPSVVVKSSPDESGTQLFLIHEGLKVKVMDEMGDWRLVKLSDGNMGWLKVVDIVAI